MRNIKGSSVGWTETTPVGNFNLQEGLKVPEMIKKDIPFVFPNFSERCLTKAKSTAMYCKIYNIVKYMKTKSSKINNLRSKHNINRQKKIIENRKNFVEVKRKFFKLSWFLKGLLKLIYSNNTNLGGKSTKYKYTK